MAAREVTGAGPTCVGAVVMPVIGGETTCVPVRLVNPNPVEVMVHKGTKVAVVE